MTEILHPFANTICYVCGRGFADAKEALRHLLSHPGRSPVELTAGSLLDALDGTNTVATVPPPLTPVEIDALQDAHLRTTETVGATAAVGTVTEEVVAEPPVGTTTAWPGDSPPAVVTTDALSTTETVTTGAQTRVMSRSIDPVQPGPTGSDLPLVWTTPRATDATAVTPTVVDLPTPRPTTETITVPTTETTTDPTTDTSI